MDTFATTIPTDALTLHFITQGHSARFPDGLVHQKIVPCTIVAQVLFGAYEISCDGRTELIRAGEAFLTPANRLMTIVHHGDPACEGWMGARWAHVHFTLFNTLDLTSLLDLPLRLEAAHAQPLGEIIQELIEAESAAGNGVQPARELHWLARRQELAFAMLRRLCEAAPPRPESLGIMRQSRRLEAVFSYVREHLAEPIAVAHLARLTHMSLSRFHAFFREHMSCTPMDYVKSTRLNEACKSLMAGEESIARIAERVGFRNQFHFSREFKLCFKMTPSQYRRSSNARYEDVLISATTA